ncbi:hypothetical protein PIB30_082779 [Stylosanthes scabra]|uniref:MARVEL domain-containing protein n=1 Tax=Stylosanthes scabra TaxID=79078 RepID=A0ABU6VRS6_9FABA|nr:hypothetical protein [Stylosanthes scabra]
MAWRCSPNMMKARPRDEHEVRRVSAFVLGRRPLAGLLVIFPLVAACRELRAPTPLSSLFTFAVIETALNLATYFLDGMLFDSSCYYLIVALVSLIFVVYLLLWVAQYLSLFSYVLCPATPMVVSLFTTDLTVQLVI